MAKVIRPIRVEGNVAFIPLTQGYEAVIDAEDVGIVAGKNWSALVKRRVDGSITSVYAIRWGREAGKQRIVRMHRVIADPPDGMDPDHIDGNGLNNRRNNLRAATRAQNTRNQRKARHNASGVKGVSWEERRHKWRAQIKAGGIRRSRYFDSKGLAAAKYAEWSAEMHGDFGRIG